MNDHRKLGRELSLFDTDPLIGAGLPYWLPDGAAVRHALEEYLRSAESRAGYQHVYSPVLAKRELYEISGHWAHYRDDMYPPMRLGSGPDAEQIVLRPSLCPHHTLIYRSRARSYRELPLRLAELGGMYRAELSGVLGGLTRVRAIQLNDAHIFCPLDQVAAEASAALDMIRAAYRALGIRPLRYRLSLPGPGEKYVEDPQMRERAADLLASVLESAGVACGPRSPGPDWAASGPGSAPRGWSPTRPSSAPARPRPARWRCGCATAAAWNRRPPTTPWPGSPRWSTLITPECGRKKSSNKGVGCRSAKSARARIPLATVDHDAGSGFSRWKVSQPPPRNRIEPGLTELTRIPSGASSCAATVASWISAALAAA
jgi:hypothetical protein